MRYNGGGSRYFLEEKQMFGLNKKTKPKVVEPYVSKPKFYEGDETPFGVFALIEDCITALPIDPKPDYLVRGKEVTDWRLGLYSTTEDKTLGFIEYYAALEKLRTLADIGTSYLVGEKDGFMVTTELTLEQMKTLLSSREQ